MVTGMGSFIMSFGIWANDESEMPNRSSKGINLRMVFLFLLNGQLLVLVLRCKNTYFCSQFIEKCWKTNITNPFYQTESG